MQRIKRAVLMVLVVLIAVLFVGCAGGYWFITKSHPQINGTLRAPGLIAQVEIIRDAMGVPHIYAQHADDLFFAQGYVHAQDRLWQMEYNRRIGHATLSDVLGAAAIDYDRFLRTIGLARAARADYAALSAADRRPLEAYARGVNAFIETHRDNLPIEFTLLGYTPAPWEPVDTIVWGKVMGYQLSGQYEADLFRHTMLKQIGEVKLKELLPPYPAEGPFVVPPEAREYKSQIPSFQIPNIGSLGNPDWNAIAKMDELLAMHDAGIGSNNWVIGGAKSATGKPILANDPHLGIQMPSIWYANGLHCIVKTDDCPYNVVGFSFPAAPGVVIGHNERIAWGVTTPYADVADLYVEKINPQNPNQYEYQGKWLDFEIVEEPIKVKGVVSETLKIKISRHGPIITPVLPGVTEPLAFQWTGLRERSRLFAAVLQINRARNWDEFRAALKLWDVPSQNFVYADVEGNIGYQLPGNIPIRAKGNGMFPAEGRTGEYEWTRYIPFDELPSVFNPPTHFMASANNCIVPATYKYWLSYDCAAPFRQQRIFDLIKAKDKLTIEDVEAMHRDTYSAPEARLKTYLAALTPDGLLQARALEYVKAWDGYLTMDNVGGTITAVTLQRAVRNVFGNKLDADLAKAYFSHSDYHQRVLLTLLEQPTNAWWDDPTTKEPPAETRDVILQKSFAEAVEWLSKNYGETPAEWKWSRVHTATFAHTLGSVQPLNLLFNVGPVGAPGGEATVMRMGFRANVPFVINTASSMRMIVDLGNLANSRYIHTTGQAGQPLHKHYSDMVLLWRDGLYVPMPFDRAKIDATREGVLVLVP